MFSINVCIDTKMNPYWFIFFYSTYHVYFIIPFYYKVRFNLELITFYGFVFNSKCHRQLHTFNQHFENQEHVALETTENQGEACRSLAAVVASEHTSKKGSDSNIRNMCPSVSNKLAPGRCEYSNSLTQRGFEPWGVPGSALHAGTRAVNRMRWTLIYGQGRWSSTRFVV